MAGEDGTQGAEGADGAKGGGTLTFDDWFAKRTNEEKGLLTNHVHGLKTALESAKATREELKATLAKKDAEAASSVDAMRKQIEAAEQREAVVDALVGAECVNLKAAYVLAREDGLIKGNKVDIVTLKTNHPYLFRKAASGNAGSGAGTTLSAAGDANTAIRRAAGRV